MQYVYEYVGVEKVKVLNKMEIEKVKVQDLKVFSDPRLKRSSISINLYHPVNMQYVYEYVYVCGG